MSKYNKEKMFFIQTPIKFWYRQDIIWLQNQPDGYQILTLYNKLMGLTANMDGYLLKQFGDVKEPYTNEEIAKITMHDLSIVEKIKLLFNTAISTPFFIIYAIVGILLIIFMIIDIRKHLLLFLMGKKHINHF